MIISITGLRDTFLLQTFKTGLKLSNHNVLFYYLLFYVEDYEGLESDPNHFSSSKCIVRDR